MHHESGGQMECMSSWKSRLGVAVHYRYMALKRKGQLAVHKDLRGQAIPVRADPYNLNGTSGAVSF